MGRSPISANAVPTSQSNKKTKKTRINLSYPMRKDSSKVLQIYKAFQVRAHLGAYYNALFDKTSVVFG